MTDKKANYFCLSYAIAIAGLLITIILGVCGYKTATNICFFASIIIGFSGFTLGFYEKHKIKDGEQD